MDYSKLGITPIDEQNPSGEDVKYDEDFELIEGEISKLTSAYASSVIDWDVVSKLSYEILETKSKNILVAAYLSYALFKQNSMDGLADGVKVMADILENFWETLYPPKRRLKGRINAVEWWLDKVSKDLENMDDVEMDEDEKSELISNLKRVDDFLNKQLDDAPLFYNLIKLLDMKLVTKSENIQEVVEEKVEQKTVKTVKVATSVLSSNVEADFKANVNTLNMLTGQMIETKDYRAELFMINRAFAWLDIDELPSSQNKITMLPPPDAQEIKLLNSLYDEKNYEALVWAAESRITTYLFWLDLHCFVAESLKYLNHTQASEVVYQQIQYFIKKLPNLQNLSFLDSTPFASKATKKWLKPKELKEEIGSSSKLKENDPNLSIDDLCERMSRSSSVKEQVIYNIKICKSLSKSNDSTLIFTYTKKLLDTIERYLTAQWSPEIALEAYLVSIESLQSIEDEVDSELLSSLFTKVALLKPSLIEELKS